jgi:hypothetical protein
VSEFRIRTDRLKHLEAVHPLHQEVADDHVRLVGRGKRDAFGAVQGRVHGESLMLEEVGQELHRARVVVDEKNGLSHGERSSRLYPAEFARPRPPVSTLWNELTFRINPLQAGGWT